MSLIIKICCSFILITTCAFGYPMLSWGINDAIIAVVNEEVITLKDLHEYLQAMYMQLIAEGKSPAQIDKIMTTYEANGLNRLIEDKLLVNEANQKGMEVRQKAVDDRINEIKNKYPSEKAFMDSLIHEGLTLTDLKNKITDQFKARYVVEFEVKKKIFVNPQEVNNYYEKNIQNFVKPERIDLESIFIPLEDDKNLSRQKADEALQAIKGGQDFQKVAPKYTQTPSVGIIERGQMKTELENIAFDLKEGEVSEAIETDDGVYIFKIKKKYPSEAQALQEVKNEIYNLIFQEKFQTRLKAWLEKLRKQAYVEIKQ